VEGRKNSAAYQKIKVGDHIEFFEGSRSFLVQVAGINHYLSVEEYLSHETLERALPGRGYREEGFFGHSNQAGLTEANNSSKSRSQKV
jgi:ASC-1-like (ASCH) protein